MAPEPVQIGLVAHYAFCPRRAWLEVAGEKTDTRQVAIGLRAHEASDDPSRSRPDRVRAVDVASEQLGLTGRCDAVHFLGERDVEVIEHKATPVRREPRVTEPMRVQLSLQRRALQDSGYRVLRTALWFSSHSVEVQVDLDDDDDRLAVEMVERTRAVVEAASSPPPLEDDPRCSSCSHIDVCLPDERALAPVTRRIVVADPDSQVVHLATYGSRASTQRGRLRLERQGEELASVPLERVQGLVVHGNVDLSGGLIRELLYRGLPIVWCTSGGKVVGWAGSAWSPNGEPRARQAVASQSGRLDLAREFVTAKIAGQATLLRRGAGSKETVARLRHLQHEATAATSLEGLLGVEGDAAARYFQALPGLLRAPMLSEHGAGFAGRVRRPATDLVNAALNLAYALLLADTIRAVLSCGLDPHHGFLHSSGRNKPALALDLAEEFRAAVADSAVVGAFNNGELQRHDFSVSLGAWRLREKGRKALITAYERRVNGRFAHPVFGYQVTWRRAMEVQARLILGVLDRSMPKYVGVRTR